MDESRGSDAEPDLESLRRSEDTIPASLEEPDLLVPSALGNGGRLLGFRLIQFGFLFLLSLVATRALGPDGRGQYALALNLATVVWVVSHFSVEQSIARLLARKEASIVELSHLASAFSLVLGLLGTAMALAIGIPARGAMLGGASVMTVALGAATIPFTLIGQMATALLLRSGELRAYGWILAVGAFFQFLLVVGFEVGLGLTPELTMLAALATIAAVAVALSVVLGHRLGYSALLPKVDKRLIRSALRIGVSLQPASIALWLNLKIDLLIVGLLASTHAAGVYSLSANLADIVFAAVSTIGLAALETQTRADAEQAVSYTADFISRNLVLASVIGFLAAAVAFPFIVLVYGDAWQGSVLPFVVLMPAVIALAVEGPARDLLVRIAPPRSISAAAAAGLALNIPLNFLLIPKIGIVGASIASVMSYWLAAFLMLYLVSRYSGLSMRRALRPPSLRGSLGF